VRDIAIGIKRTTFLRQQVKKSINESSRLYPELVEGFVLAPNKDLAVSVQFFNWSRPSSCDGGRLALSSSAFLFAPRPLRETAVSRYYFRAAFATIGVRTFLPSGKPEEQSLILLRHFHNTKSYPFVKLLAALASGAYQFS